jgi:hypothetical protein
MQQKTLSPGNQLVSGAKAAVQSPPLDCDSGLVCQPTIPMRSIFLLVLGIISKLMTAKKRKFCDYLEILL